FRRVLYEVEEYLDQLIPVSVNRRKRRIVLFNDVDITGEAALCQRLNPIEDDMDVDWEPVDRTLVREDLHSVHQRHDTICFILDEASQWAIFIADDAFQQLRRAAYSRQWILDFMGEHGSEPGDGPCRSAMRHLTVDLVRHRPLLKHDDDMPLKFRHRGNVKIDDPILAKSR